MPHLDVLVSALRQHGLPVPEADLRAVFESEEYQIRSAATRWVDANISPATLLTPEEAALIEALAREYAGGSEEQLLANADSLWAPVTGLPLTDAELAASAAAIESTTATLERQARALEAQRDALAALREHNGSSRSMSNVGAGTRRSASVARAAAQTDKRRRKYAQECSEIVGRIEDAAYSVRARLESRQKQARALIASARSQLEGLLAEHDRELAALDNLLQGNNTKAGLDWLDEADMDHEKLMADIQTTVAVRTSTQNAVVDAIYSDALANAPDEIDLGGLPGSDVFESHAMLQHDLDALFAEIPTVADMAATHALRDPVRKALAKYHEAQIRDKSEAFQRGQDSLKRLCDSVVAAEAFVRHVSALHTTLDAISNTIPKPALTAGQTQNQAGQRSVMAGAVLLSGSHRSAAEAALQHFDLHLDSSTLASIANGNDGRWARNRALSVVGSVSGSSQMPYGSFGGATADAAASAASKSLAHDISMKRLKVGAHADKVNASFRPVLAALDREEADVVAILQELFGDGLQIEDAEGAQARFPLDGLRGKGVQAVLGELSSTIEELAERVEKPPRGLLRVAKEG